MRLFSGPFNTLVTDIVLGVLGVGFIIGAGLLTVVEPRTTERQTAEVIDTGRIRVVIPGPAHPHALHVDVIYVRTTDNRRIRVSGRAKIGTKVCVQTKTGQVTEHLNAKLLPLSECRP